jgi:hypothetical protein
VLSEVAQLRGWPKFRGGDLLNNLQKYLGHFLLKVSNSFAKSLK